jgi:hypothetical protein
LKNLWTNKISFVAIVGSALSVESKAEYNSNASVNYEQKMKETDKKVEALEKKVEDLSSQLIINSQQKPETIAVANSLFPNGYTVISGMNSAIRLSGRIKADGSYYPGTYTNQSGDSINTPTIPIQNIDPKAGRSGHFAATAQSSRLQIDTITKTASDELTGTLLVDFFGPNANSQISINTSTAGPGYGIQVRQAFLAYKGFTVGQLETNFFEPDSNPNILEYNGISFPRRPQIRYTYEFDKITEFSVSAEQSNTDYTGQDGGLYDNSQNGISGMPDLTTRLRFSGKLGTFAVSGVVRSLGVRVSANDSINSTQGPNGGTLTTPTSSVNFNSKQTGWGLGIGFKLLTAEVSNILGSINIGKGLGGYLSDAANQSAYLQVPISGQPTIYNDRFSARLDTNTVVNGTLGYEHWWTDTFRTVVFGSYTKIKNSPFTPVMSGTTQVNARIKKVYVNAIYSPIKNMDIGIEFVYGLRETIKGQETFGSSTAYKYDGGTGKATQIMTSIIYNF